MSEATVAATVEMPVLDQGFGRADLVFGGVDHSGPSYQMVIRLIGTDSGGSVVADVGAGSFFVFGHGGCFGDEGHCDVRSPVSIYDNRHPHQLTPTTCVVVITEAMKALLAARATHFRIQATPIVKESPFAKAADADAITMTDAIELRVYD